MKAFQEGRWEKKWVSGVVTPAVKKSCIGIFFKEKRQANYEMVFLLHTIEVKLTMCLEAVGLQITSMSNTY